MIIKYLNSLDRRDGSVDNYNNARSDQRNNYNHYRDRDRAGTFRGTDGGVGYRNGGVNDKRNSHDRRQNIRSNGKDFGNREPEPSRSKENLRDGNSIERDSNSSTEGKINNRRRRKKNTAPHGGELNEMKSYLHL